MIIFPGYSQLLFCLKIDATCFEKKTRFIFKKIENIYRNSFWLSVIQVKFGPVNGAALCLPMEATRALTIITQPKQ